jgi:hypothetical protein
MAKLGLDYSVDVENTEKQGGGGLLPVMYARVWAETIEFVPTPDNKGTQAAMTFEVQEPEEFKSRKFWSYWTIQHEDGFKYGQYKYGKPMFDRFARSVDVDVNADTDSDDMLFKSFVAKIGIQVGGPKKDNPSENYKDKNQIEHFYYSDAGAKEPIPELGVIGDGTPAKKSVKPAVAANQNARPSTPATAAKPAGAKPWGKKAA